MYGKIALFALFAASATAVGIGIHNATANSIPFFVPIVLLTLVWGGIGVVTVVSRRRTQ